MSYRHFEVEEATVNIGAMVSGIDLTQPMSAEICEELKQALWRYQVLFFRDQALTPDSHVALAATMGEMETHEIFDHVEGYPAISIIQHDKDHKPNINFWHTDVTFRAKPSLASILHGVTVPDSGGDTLWLSQQAAYEGLSDSMKQIVLGLQAEHSGIAAYRGSQLLAEAGAGRAEALAAMTPSIHPVVVRHPFTGKPGLFVNPTFTTKLVGYKREEGKALLEMLYRHMQKPEYQVRFRWRNDSVAIWDNVATQHYAVADYYPKFRSMRRIVISGMEPVAWQAAA